MPRLNEQEAAMTGYTDTWDIDHNDLTNSTDNGTQTLTYSVPAGAVVEAVDIQVLTNFDDSGGGDELNLDIGDGADPNGYVASVVLHTDESVSTYSKGNGALVDGEGKLYTTADTIDALFTPNISTGTDYALSELNAGKIRVFMRIRRMGE